MCCTIGSRSSLVDVEKLKQEEEAEDAEVTWEDQQKICAFSKMNARFRTFEGKLNGLKASNVARPNYP